MAPGVASGWERPVGERRRIEDLRFVVVGAYVVDCFVRVPRLPAWGEELEAPTVHETIGAAHSCGARVIVQPAPAMEDLSGAASLPWDQVDVLVPNEAEARALLEGSPASRDLTANDLAGALSLELTVPA